MTYEKLALKVLKIIFGRISKKTHEEINKE